jgi:hypothetical protein
MSARRIATAIVGAEIGLAGLFGAFGVLHSNAVAYASPADTATILLSEIHNPDMLPVCDSRRLLRPAGAGRYVVGPRYRELVAVAWRFVIAGCR